MKKFGALLFAFLLLVSCAAFAEEDTVFDFSAGSAVTGESAQSAAEIRRNRSPARTFASLEKNRGKTVDILRMVCYNDRG